MIPATIYAALPAGDPDNLSFKAFGFLRKKRRYFRETRCNSALVRHRTAEYQNFSAVLKLIVWQECSHYETLIHEPACVQDYVVPVLVLRALKSRCP